MNRIFALLLGMSCALNAANTITLSNDQITALGKKIWQRECGGTIEGLTHWHKNEAFPSLGIGHFIWYPKNKEETYTQTFPDLITFLQAHNVTIPIWLARAIHTGCPWSDKASFMHQLKGKQLYELRMLLSSTIELQTKFIIHRFENSFAQIVAQAPKNKYAHIMRQYNRLSQSTQGLFAMIDYLHFKGAGTNPNERYNNNGWGLLQVLTAMKDKPVKQALHEFNAKAKDLLRTRVANSANKAKEERWLPGWFARIDSYIEQV